MQKLVYAVYASKKGVRGLHQNTYFFAEVRAQQRAEQFKRKGLRVEIREMPLWRAKLAHERTLMGDNHVRAN